MKLSMEVGLGSGDIVLYGDPALLQKGHSPQFLAHVCCDQTAAWIKMLLGKEVGFSPGDIGLYWDLAPPNKGAH